MPFHSVPEHLMATEISRWDKLIGKRVPIPITPMKNSSVAAKLFINQLAQSLKTGGYIRSKDDILDAGSRREWVEKLLSLPRKPVEGITVFDGYIDESGYTLRARNGFSVSTSPTEEDDPIIKKCFIQTFTETYPKFFPVHYNQKEEEAPTRTQPALQPMDLLCLEKSRLLSQIPSLRKSATNRRALLPIFVDSGIKGWLDQFDRSTLYSQFPQCPAAGRKSTPKSYTRLAKANLILFKEDLKALDDSHHSIRHVITNATP